MKRRKLALQIEHLRLLNYQVKLDCFQRETALSLPHDPLTISLVSKEGNKTDNNNNNSNVMAECISEDELDHFCVEDEEY